MSRRASKKNLLTEPVELLIETLSHDGRGIARIEGKTVFVAGALPGERVTARYRRRKRRYDEADTLEILAPAAIRVTPRCPHFGVCGGCSLQHMAADAQLELKQNTLLEQFRHIGTVEPESVLPPLAGPLWQYRRRARLGVKYVIKKGRVLVGFRERSSPYVAELERCEVLRAAVGERIELLRATLEQLEAREHIAQIEVAVADNATVLTLRNLQTLSAGDRERLCEFAQAHDLHLYLQPGGPDTLEPLWPATPVELYYALPDDGLRVYFAPLDFIQVNAAMNARMLQRALELMQVGADDRVLELFCGLGNFTLPLARRAAHVTAVEGDAGLVARAAANAERQGLDNITYYSADLAAAELALPWLQQSYDKILLDPPRSGALEVIQQLDLGEVARIVYVSCSPATLARDAGELVRKGFALRSAGVMDMFPHTAHVESIALFEHR